MLAYKKPLIALILGILPFFLFIGTSNTVRMNGQVVSENHFNFGGIVLALIGIGLAWRVLSERRAAPKGRKLLAGLAALICVLQLVSASGVWRIDPLDWLIPERYLPAPQYKGLADRDKVRIVITPPSYENYRNALTHRKVDIIHKARVHNTYATLCHGGRSRVDLARAEAEPAIFDTELQESVKTRLTQIQAKVPDECSEQQSIRIIALLADDVNERMDLFDRLIDDYSNILQSAPSP